MPLNTHRTVSRACLVGLLLVVTGSVSAAGVWTALLDVGDGVEIDAVRIVADSEDACLAQIASQRGAVIVAPCRPTASAIVDPNDANLSNGQGRHKQPSPVSGSGGGGGGGW